MKQHLFKLRFVSLLVCMAWMGVAGTARGADSPPRDAQLKAAFIYNFVQFTEWPSNAFTEKSPDLVIGILRSGDNDLLPAAVETAVKGKQAGGRRIVVIHFSSINEVQPCHALVLRGISGTKLTGVLRQIEGTPTLTIGEADGFAASGGIIRLYEEDNRMRFEISIRAAAAARVKVSAKLLKLAKVT